MLLSRDLRACLVKKSAVIKGGGQINLTRAVLGRTAALLMIADGATFANLQHHPILSLLIQIQG